MVDLLSLDLQPIESIEWQGHDAVVMVDSQPKTGRHSLDDAIDLYAVIDHHETPGELKGVPFNDIRPHLGATCTLATKYLAEQDVEIPEKVATALLYGIETEVDGVPPRSVFVRRRGPSVSLPAGR